MLSTDFTVSKKYSIKDKKFISTSSYLPWKYTSLYDNRYKPELSDEIRFKLLNFCTYRFLYSTENLFDEGKYLRVEYDENQTILSYEIVNSFHYKTIAENYHSWKHFVESVGCEDLNLCKDNIDRMTDETDDMVTYVISMQYDSNADFRNIMIFDKSYNLVGYDENKTLHMLNDICKENQSKFNGTIGFYPDSDELKFKIYLNFSRFQILSPLGDRKKYLMNKLNYKEQRDIYLTKLKEANLLSEDDVDYMNSIFTENSRFDIEYFLNEDGTIKDIVMHNFVVYEFEEL